VIDSVGVISGVGGKLLLVGVGITRGCKGGMEARRRLERGKGGGIRVEGVSSLPFWFGGEVFGGVECFKGGESEKGGRREKKSREKEGRRCGGGGRDIDAASEGSVHLARL
jgi:hypothetical protein